jgi:hypothetical protein
MMHNAIASELGRWMSYFHVRGLKLKLGIYYSQVGPTNMDPDYLG